VRNTYLSAHEDPVDYCKAIRQLLESTRDRLRSFWQRNLVTIAMLRRNLPDLQSEKGEHFADILTSLYKKQMKLIARNRGRMSRELQNWGKRNLKPRQTARQVRHLAKVRAQSRIPMNQSAPVSKSVPPPIPETDTSIRRTCRSTQRAGSGTKITSVTLPHSPA
jgi:hypothetical protein